MSKEVIKINDYKGYPELFHDQALYFISPLEPSKNSDITLRLRAKKGDVKDVNLTVLQNEKITEYPMHKIVSDFDKTGKYEFYEVTFNVGEEGFFYCFAVTSALDGKFYYYYEFTDHSSIGNRQMNDKMPLEFPDDEQNGWYVLPGYKGPAWSQGMSWYSIMPDAFYNGDPANDDMQSDENYDVPWNIHHFGLRDRYGGDFDGVMQKADYIKDLGCEGVFYSPIQKAEQNAGYGTDDFDQLESSFCNADKYSEFIEYMHGKGLRLMQDVVVYFTTFEGMYINQLDRWPAPMLEIKDGKSLNKQSPYYNLFCDADNGGHPMWNGFTLNHYDKSVGDMLYGEKETPLLRYADKNQGFGVDGYRFDCGGWITGHEGTSDDYPFESENHKKGRHYSYRTHHVMPPIYNKIKEINPEFNVLSESSGADQFRKGYWDSHWNIGVNKAFERLLNPDVGTTMDDVHHALFHNNVKSKPRSASLCSKLQINTHDESKNNMRPAKFNAWKAARLIQMTYVGSPSVYYGEEHNFGGTNFKNRYGQNRNGFSFFDWDESRWDHKMFGFFKAMLELRKEYSAIRTGAYMQLGHNDDVIDYARFDENGTVITLASQSDEIQTHTIDAASCNLIDGTTFTDWLTGEEFTVKGGELTVDVIPGGRVLVCGGKKTSSFRLGYTADGDCTNDISDETAKTVSVKNVGFDKFYLLPAFASFKFNAKIEGNGIATIRNCTCFGAMNIEVEVKGDTLTVSADGKVVTTAKTDGNVTLYRKADNTFGVEGVKDSEVKIPMDDKVYVGFGVRKGDATFTKPEILEFEARPLCDDFNGTLTAMLRNPEGLVAKNGYLEMTPESTVTTRSTDHDWTFKAKLNYLPENEGDFAGVISKQDDKNMVIAGRTLKDGKVYIFTAKTVNGNPVIIEKRLDANPDKEVVIQLQRIGTGYTAVYSYDGSIWYSLGTSIFMNLCYEAVGVRVKGNTVALVDYLSFGDAINDGESFFTPETPVMPYNPLPVTEEKRSFKLRFVGGDWQKAPEGWRNPDTNTREMAIVNKEYKDFRAEASFNLLNGDGWVGFAFGKYQPSSPADAAYSLRFDANGFVKLCKGNTEITSAKVPLVYMQTRLVLEVKGERAIVYSGRDLTTIIDANLSGYSGGYFTFAAVGAAADVGNFNICSANARLFASHPSNYRTENGKLIIQGEGNAAVFHRDVALTNYVLTATVTLKDRCKGWCSAGFLLSNMYGIDNSHEEVGIYLSCGHDGLIRLEDKGVDLLPPYRRENADAPVKLTVVKQGKEYKVYVGNSAKPVFEYTQEKLMGGVLAFDSHNSNTVFSDVAISNVPNGVDPLTLDICKHLK